MARTAELRFGNVWLSSIAECGDLEWSTRWPGGCFEASWSMALPSGHLPSFLRRGQIGAIRVGSNRVWRGQLAQPQPDEGMWKFTARGLHRIADQYYALTGAGASTSTPNTAIDAAIARGLTWARIQSFSTTPIVDGDGTDALNKVSALLDAWADEAGERWAVDADGFVYHAPDPTVPTWHIAPVMRPMGLSDENYASHLAGRYIRSSDLSYQTVWAIDTSAEAAFDHAEGAVDLTTRGPMTSARAQAIVDGILGKGRSRLGWTDSIEASRWELTTPGGCPADLRFVRAGQLVRQFGVTDPHTGQMRYVDFVIGETRYREGEGLVSLVPMDKTPTDLAEALEKATKRGAA